MDKDLIFIDRNAIYERKLYLHSFPYSDKCIRLVISKYFKKNSQEEERLKEAIEKLNNFHIENEEKYISIIIQNLKEHIEKFFGDKLKYFQLKYALNLEEKDRFKVQIKDKQLFFYDGTIVDSQNLFLRIIGRKQEDDAKILISISESFKEFIEKSLFSCFIVDEKNDLYITPYRIGTNHHNFLTDKVKIAGLIFVKEGKICYLSNLSGHFKPEASRISGILIPKLIELSKDKCNIRDIFAENFNFDRYLFPSDTKKIIFSDRYRGIEFIDDKGIGNRQFLELRKNIKSQIGLEF